jgi:transposase
MRQHRRMHEPITDTAPDLETLRTQPLDRVRPTDHGTLFVEDFVDSLDLDALGFIEAHRPNLRAPHSASKLLKVMLFAMVLGIVSMRAMARLCRWDLRLLYLCRYDPPRRSSIGRFWRANHGVFIGVFETLVRRAAEAGHVGMDLHAIDGTKMRAASSMHTGLHRATLMKTLEKLNAQFDKQEGRNATTSLRDQCRRYERIAQQRTQTLEKLALLDKQNVDHLHPNEPDASVMKVDPRPLFAYNAQLVVDHEHDLIVAVKITTDENDTAQLVPMLEETKRMVGTTAKQTALDKGYFSGEQLDKANQQQFPVLVPPPCESDKGLLPKSSFAYDKERDVYICPTGEVLPRVGTSKRDCNARHTLTVYRCHNRECAERAACTRDPKGRSVKRSPFDEACEQQRTLLAQPAMRNLSELRKEIIEHHFGDIKSNYGFRRFTVRGLLKVLAQFVLACIACNLRKLSVAWVAGLFSWPPGVAYG